MIGSKSTRAEGNCDRRCASPDRCSGEMGAPEQSCALVEIGQPWTLRRQNRPASRAKDQEQNKCDCASHRNFSAQEQETRGEKIHQVGSIASAGSLLHSLRKINLNAAPARWLLLQAPRLLRAKPSRYLPASSWPMPHGQHHIRPPLADRPIEASRR